MFDARVIHTDLDFDWIVLIHGLGGNADTWKKQEDAYAMSYNLILLNMHEDMHEVNQKKDPVEKQEPAREQETAEVHKQKRVHSPTLTVKSICDHIIETMDHFAVPKAHVVSISSGTMIALALLADYPQRISSLVMAGGIIRFNFRTKVLLSLAHVCRKKIPYMCLYRFFAFIIMPRENHRKSREIFIREAAKIGKAGFCIWIEIIPELYQTKPLIDKINRQYKAEGFSEATRILYILGRQDHLFFADTKKLHAHIAGAKFIEIKDCGHVCAIEKHEEFTQRSLEFMRGGFMI